jgi:nicotinate-nucleotide pyrophosphorylase (carboxylating)
MEKLLDFPKFEEIRQIIQLARAEDLRDDDVTSRLFIDENTIGVGTLLQKEVGITCGLPLVEMVCRVYDERLRMEQIPGFHVDVLEGRFSDSRTLPLVRVRGPLRQLLAAERVVLNFLQHLGGVATITNRFVRRVEGTAAKIYDTRKTLPGLRALEKYAVRCGGGKNHRIGLFDGVLIKDNHIAGIAAKDLPAAIARAVAQNKSESAERFVEVEVESLEQLREVLKVDGVNLILLDNMDCPKMASAVEMRDKAGKKGEIALEASGGVTLETVRAIALSGVDRISVGAITHSAPALDISMEIET